MKLSPVLIIDDDEADRYLLRRLLKKGGLADVFYEAKDGREALELLSDPDSRARVYPDWSTPELVFLDINMPVINGFEFLEAFEPLSKQHGYESVAVIMFSSSRHDEDRERALAFDCVKGFIVKEPSGPVEFCDQLVGALNLS